ncbi:MAG: thermonuclease family protein [Bacilli bacterium]|nr:thermonuclease family protein [Bacilli bacterium]
MKKIILSLIIFLFVFNVSAEEKVSVTLKSCVDGDTANFIMKKKEIKVRFLAIDAPEIKHGSKKADPYGEEAKFYTCSELKKADNIYLEFDDNSDKLDRYDRYLAWVFVDDDLLQYKIVKKGLAKVAYLYDDYKYTDVLKKAENKAKISTKGIWSNNKLEFDFDFIKENYIYIIIVVLFVLLICLISKKARKLIKKKIYKKIKKY